MQQTQTKTIRVNIVPAHISAKNCSYSALSLIADRFEPGPIITDIFSLSPNFPKSTPEGIENVKPSSIVFPIFVNIYTFSLITHRQLVLYLNLARQRYDPTPTTCNCSMTNDWVN
ncbi:hypothetical protein WA026_017062 [Henosepilachna vigintioctopunctata]|uniref:Uncharacterized protein n=1 Tax=Henosepilachna vigintioctopunctata TaxID=420089 RepID=A0AAW1TLK1_9CUCU